MLLLNDQHFQIILGLLLGLLLLASLVGYWLTRHPKQPGSTAVIANLNARIKAWWVMIVVFLLALLCGPLGTIILFGFISLLALREYLALSPTLRSDHRVLLWLVFFVLPCNYTLIATRWYGFFIVFIPVYAFLGLQIRAAITGATDSFLDRTARIQWGMMMTIYCVSHVPALQMLDIPGYSAAGNNPKLMLFLVIVVQASDVCQYIVGKLAGRHPIAPRVSPNKTVEGFFGGILLATLLGMSLFWLTPFTPWQTSGLALVICLMGFAGGLVMSAMKRDRGIKDFGTLLPGHGGILDRIDSLCFAAPIFFHLTRYFFA
ncbi:MAG: phosphatidate cytidylyltransferase [Alphaproteobacteria bacterium]|nr:phosphatidate cytidylyltransferase [Alphaproteobacteria bacterium]